VYSEIGSLSAMMSVLVAMPAKVRGAAASEGEVRLQSLVATWVRGRGVDGGLNGSKNAMCEQRKAGCYSTNQKQDAAVGVRRVVSDVGLFRQAKLRERGL